MDNKDLSKFYDAVYKKGERTHYSRYKIGASKEFDEIIGEIAWKGKKVLDVGCGTGLFDFLIAKRGADVLAIDFAPEAIAVASKTYEASNLKFEEGAAHTISGKYDVIVSLGTLEHMDDPLVTLKKFKKHLNPGGVIMVTCPNWTNPRGYILMTLRLLFNAPITLADLHYLTPVDFGTWANKLSMKVRSKTFDQSWANGKVLIHDLRRRLPNVFRDAKMDVSEEKIKDFLTWLEQKAIPIDQAAPWSGAMALYILEHQ